jgi:hypothetical protein
MYMHGRSNGSNCERNKMKPNKGNQPTSYRYMCYQEIMMDLLPVGLPTCSLCGNFFYKSDECEVAASSFSRSELRFLRLA